MIACRTCGALLLEDDEEDRDLHTEWHNQSQSQMKRERRGPGLRAQLTPFMRTRCKP